jgi:hypothetical protein
MVSLLNFAKFYLYDSDKNGDALLSEFAETLYSPGLRWFDVNFDQL